MSTGIIWDERYLNHDTGVGHPESPQRLIAIKEVLDSDSSLITLKPRMATAEEIGWVHTPEHIQKIESLCRDNPPWLPVGAVREAPLQNGRPQGAAPTYLDPDTPVTSGSRDAAFLAAGGLLTAIEAIQDKKISNAFAFPRPPGHHAESDRAMGFCLFNNVAIGAEYLLRKKNLKKIAIVDIDVHHGNGTQHFFYDRDDVFYISTHRYPFYPGTGAANEKGKGKGEGFTLNLPYPALADDDDYQKGYDEKIIPALLKYKPEFILVSAGFDAHKRDPLGGMRITKKGFEMMSRSLFEIAKKIGHGKIVFVLEGGYDMKGLQEGVEAVLDKIKN